MTGTRADYGLLRPTLLRLRDDPRFELQLIVCAMHLDPKFGNTVAEIEADGLPIIARLQLPAGEDRSEYAGQIGRGVTEFAAMLSGLAPDFLLLLGDRHEILSAALAAATLQIPIAHVHGGELSEGSLDDAMRHCIVKLSHFHFVAAREYAERVCQLGEQPSRVFNVGAAGIESIKSLDLLDRAELSSQLGVDLTEPVATVTFHPESLDDRSAERHAAQLVDALEHAFGDAGTVVVTLPNDDLGNRPVRDALRALAERSERVHAFDSLGQLRYLSLLATADVVIGNSSSGLIETPSFKLPTVNIGERQAGRIRSANVIDAPIEGDAIVAAIEQALEPEFRERLADSVSPYGDGNVSARVLDLLASIPLDRSVIIKRFVDLPGEWRNDLRLGSDQ